MTACCTKESQSFKFEKSCRSVNKTKYRLQMILISQCVSNKLNPDLNFWFKNVVPVGQVDDLKLQTRNRTGFADKMCMTNCLIYRSDIFHYIIAILTWQPVHHQTKLKLKLCACLRLKDVFTLVKGCVILNSKVKVTHVKTMLWQV